jgi:SAM-dependent methyltransferase
MERFVEVHLDDARAHPLEIVDFGSQQVNPASLTYRSLFDRSPWRYRGLDITAGLNVDIVVADPYRWDELAADSVDVVVSGQAFEHVEFFWASAYEIVRVLKPGGVAMIIAPSGGYEHRFPQDCWRFYADGMIALGRMLRVDVVDAYTDWGNEVWEDTVGVFRKPIWDVDERAEFARRHASLRASFTDGHVSPVGADEAAGAPAVPAPSPIGELRPGALTTALSQRSVSDRVRGRAWWFGERMAGVRGRALVGDVKRRLSR